VRSVVGLVEDRGHATVVAATVCAVRLNADECWERLVANEHGVLATMHAERGVDAVPVVYVTGRPQIFVPVDTVKRKRTTQLQRLANIESDPRCVLLVDHYVRDWTKLWWVRAHATATVTDDVPRPLTERFEEYRLKGAVAAVVVLTVSEITGWSA
jgi:PPOX class probable F420-dependent enzyme